MCAFYFSFLGLVNEINLSGSIPSQRAKNVNPESEAGPVFSGFQPKSEIFFILLIVNLTKVFSGELGIGVQYRWGTPNQFESAFNFFLRVVEVNSFGYGLLRRFRCTNKNVF